MDCKDPETAPQWDWGTCPPVFAKITFAIRPNLIERFAVVEDF